MMLNNLSFAIRNLRRNKLLSAINILGLSIGISACLMIFLIADYELAFDRFQPDRDRIYRIYSKFPDTYNSINRGVPTAVPVAVHDNFTGIKSLTNFHTFSAEVKVPQKTSETKALGRSNKIIIAGPEYFDVFNYYEWLAGDPKQSLSEPFQLVLSESAARKYFGNADLSNIIGREVIYQDSLHVTVSGIVKDIDQRTDFDFTDFISFSTIGKSWLERHGIPLNSWNDVNSASQLFIKLNEGTSADKIETQLAGLPAIYGAQHKNWDDWRPAAKLQPLSDVHFNSELGIFDNSRAVLDRSTLYVLMGVAALLLVIAVINFINLETAQASRKAKEVGVRKILGSSRQKLIWRFLSETFILCTLAVGLSVAWVSLSFRYFADFIPGGLAFHPGDPAVVIFLVSCSVGVAFLAGLYPAYLISSHQPVLALKNLGHSRGAANRSAFIRKGLTVFQFSFSQVFITGAIVIGLQLNYMVNKDLGFDPRSVVIVWTPSDGSAGQRAALKNALSQIPEIKAFGMHGAPPVANSAYISDMTFDNGKEILKHRVFIKDGDTSYLRVYSLYLVAGRNFLPVDSIREYVINETYLHALGFVNPGEAIGKTLDRSGTIVGVVKDFHTRSLHAAIEPVIISYRSDGTSCGIKLFASPGESANIKPALSKIETAWKEIYPDEDFSYFFINDTIRRYYENEQRTEKLVVMATIVAVLISCLGLFGLSTFTVIQRTKEIGIRKVMGATVKSIVILLSKEFLLLVGMAFILSVPFAYYISDQWLQAFAFRIDLGLWIFASAGLLSMIIAFLTISVRTAGAAKLDPVKTLRYE